VLPSSKIKELIISNCGLGPKSIVIVAATLATAGVERVDISKNPISGTMHSKYRGHSKDQVTYDTDVTAIQALSAIKVKSLVMQDCELGPKAITELNVSDNCITGAKRANYGKPWDKDIDADVDGIDGLFAAVASLKSLDVSSCGLGPKAVAKLASTATTAGLEAVDISENRLIGLNEYGSGAEDQTGWEALCEALPKSAIKSLKAAKCGLNPEAITKLASTLTTAGVETVDLSNNRFDPSLLDGIKHKVKLNLAGCRA
jgi:Ran GTPase-activating protein (RanGAP) involved in mRNA processing and transport